MKVGFTDKRFRAGDGKPLEMRIAVVVVADKTDERAIAAIPEGGPVQFEI